MRLSFSALQGFGMDGSHDSTTGMDEDGELIEVPRHYHNTSVDFTRLQLTASVDASSRWQVRARVPFDIYRQRSGVVLDEPATEEEQEAMWRNHDIHHADHTYVGFADPSLLGAFRSQEVLGSADSLTLSFGVSLPVGRIEPDPFELGEQGEEHSHIQHGTGTFDPLLELAYGIPVADGVSFSFSATGRFPFYENRETFRAPIQATVSTGFGYAFLDAFDTPLELTASYVLLLEGHGYWDGERDPLTGLHSHMIFAGARYDFSERTAAELEVGIPLVQSSLGDGDAFQQGIMLRLNVLAAF